MPTVLAFQSNPDDLVRLGLDKEIREINNAIVPTARRDYTLIQLGAVKITDVPQYLLEHKPDVFHFCGHGMSSGELVFQDEHGASQAINRETIKMLFEELGSSIKCVLLSSCFSKKQASEIAKYIPYVIGNSRPIADDIATLFSVNFYRSLSYGKTIQQAFNIAKAIVGSVNKKNLEIPVLYNEVPLAAEESVLFTQPIVKACFTLDESRKPKKKGREYKMKVWVEHLPRNTLSVVYNFNHESVGDDIDELPNDGSGIETEASLYGNLQLRVTIWFKDEGVGIVTSVYKALQQYYKGKKIDPAIENALNEIKAN